MATESNDYFGFELLNKLVDRELNKKEDVIILFAHWFMVKNGFRCIGLGDLKTIDGSEEGFESLPEDWNQRDNYALRYVKEGKLYILLGRKSDDNMLLNFLRVFDSCVSNVKLPVNSMVSNIHGPLKILIPNHQEVMNQIQTNLVEPVYAGTAKEISTQTLSDQETRETSRSPIVENDPLRVRYPEPSRRIPWNPLADARDVGRRDLDPFADVHPLGGGMLMDPFPRGRLRNPMDPDRPGGVGGPARLPRGAIPPGARFDPFGPPEPDRPRFASRNPDHDHLPPPDYDDMFM